MEARSVMPDLWQSITPLYYGYQECESGYSFGPAIRDCYLLHYVFSGSGTLFKNGRRYSVPADSVFVILPEEVVTYTASREDPWCYGWIAFRAEGRLPFLEQPVISSSFLRNTFSAFRDCLHEEADNCRIYGLTYDLLWKLSDHADADPGLQRNYAAYVKLHLDNTYMSDITVEGIARTLHIDRHHLTAVFRKAWGCTPKQYLTQLRLEKAKEFLDQGYSVTNAAVMAGFSDLPNFSRRYRKHFGHNPSGKSRKPEADLPPASEQQ